MDVGALMSGKANKSDLSYLLRLLCGFHRTTRRKHSVRVGIANDFVKLQQIDRVSLESLQRLVQLLAGSRFGAAIDLGHQERLLAVAIAQSPSHANFALAVVVVPA